jgi:hypothetical protein
MSLGIDKRLDVNIKKVLEIHRKSTKQVDSGWKAKYKAG